MRVGEVRWGQLYLFSLSGPLGIDLIVLLCMTMYMAYSSPSHRCLVTWI